MRFNRNNIIKTFVLSLLLLYSYSGIIAATFYSRKDGKWNNKTQWSTVGCAGNQASAFPTTGDVVSICNSHTINVSNGTAAAKDITILSGGSLEGRAGTITIEETFTNAGTFLPETSTVILIGNGAASDTFAIDAGGAEDIPSLPHGRINIWIGISNK